MFASRHSDIAAVLIILCTTTVRARAQEPARVELDVAQTGATISPLLFGHNVEITRRGIWRGLSAEMVANRKFAASEHGLPKRWTVLGDGGKVVIDDSVAYAGTQSVRVDVHREGQPYGIIPPCAIARLRFGTLGPCELPEEDSTTTNSVHVSKEMLR